MKLTPAAWMCPHCGDRLSKPDRIICYKLLDYVDPEPLFTRDDLVELVGHVRPAGRDLHGDKTDEQIVDEMLREGEG